MQDGFCSERIGCIAFMVVMRIEKVLPPTLTIEPSYGNEGILKNVGGQQLASSRDGLEIGKSVLLERVMSSRTACKPLLLLGRINGDPTRLEGQTTRFV